MLNNIHSNAFNFGSALSSGVDLRTGQYSVSISLVTLKPYNINGPERDLTLSYSALGSRNSGFGIGWSLSGTYLDFLNRKFQSANGTSFSFEIPPSIGADMRFKDQKLLDFRVHRTDTTTYQVINKEGTIETLVQMGGSSLALPVSFAFDNGETFDFEYNHWVGPERLLTSIIHRQTGIRQLELFYSGFNCIRYSYPSDNAVTASVELRYQNDLLTTVFLPFNEAGGLPQNQPHYTINYETLHTGYRVITAFRTPTGISEEINYNATLMRATMTESVPAVVRHRIMPGNNQPVIVKDYEYAPVNNFLGFNSGKTNFEEGIDNLYLIWGEYNYWARETVFQGATPVQSTERHFNRFHLMFEERITRGTSRTIKRITFNELPNVHFNDQPANLQMPHRSVVRYEEANSPLFREVTEEMETDDFGNILLNREGSGITRRYIYFPAEGITGLCPADPLGFSRFTREIRVSPVAGIAPVLADKVITYTYASHPSILNNGTSYIVKATEVLDNAVRNEYSYLLSPQNAAIHGLLSREIYTLNNQATTRNFSYQFSGGLLTKNETITGFDGIVLSSRSIRSRHTGKELEFTDIAGTRKSYQYDLWGQLISEIIHSSEGNIVETHEYVLPTGTNSHILETITRSSGVRERITYDGLGRINRIEKQDDDAALTPGVPYAGTFRVIQEKTYNTLNEVVIENDTDWYWQNQTTNQRELQPKRIIKNISYDGWGNANRIELSNGIIWIERNDQIANTITSGFEGQGMKKVQLNRFGEEENIQLMRPNGTIYSTDSFTFDGFGRKIVEVNSANHRISYTYDHFDRIISTVLPDNTVHTMQYAPFSHEEYIESISVNGSLLGRLQYDGHGRKIRETIGTRITNYEYTSGISKPSLMILPDTNRFQMQYQPILGDALLQIQGTGVGSNFSYNLQAGTLVSTHNNTFRNNFEYFPSGLQHQEQFVMNTVSRNFISRYSMRGQLQFTTDYLGNSQNNTYDQFGRLLSSSKNGIETTYTYNNSTGRVVSIVSSSSGIGVNLEIEYDEFQRETRRTFRQGNNITNVIEFEYTTLNQISRKRILLNSTVVSDENFEYDSNSRLTQYHFAEGTLRPVDQTGREVFRQVFTHDRWGNISTLRTHYAAVHDDTIYEYSSADPTQLITINTAGSGEVNLQYDPNGRLIRDELGRQLIYDSIGKLIRVNTSDGGLLCTYHYDAMGRLVEQILADNTVNRRFYTLEELANLQNGNDDISYVSGVDYPVGQHSAVSGNTLFENDLNNTLLSANSVQQTRFTYMPYGFRSIMSTLPAFTGAIVDPVTGWYFLGNGYRVYNPVLMRFHSPDSLSPFDEGGINPYTYCEGDPINNIDPSGHMSTSNIVTLSITAVSLALTATGIFAGVGVFLKGFAALARLFRFGRAARAMQRAAVEANAAYTRTHRVFDGVSAVGDVLAIGAVVADEYSENEDLARGLAYTSGGINIFGGLGSFINSALTAKRAGKAIFSVKRASDIMSVSSMLSDGVALITYAISDTTNDPYYKDVFNWASITAGGVGLGIAITEIGYDSYTKYQNERRWWQNTSRRNKGVINIGGRRFIMTR